MDKEQMKDSLRRFASVRCGDMVKYPANREAAAADVSALLAEMQNPEAYTDLPVWRLWRDFYGD